MAQAEQKVIAVLSAAVTAGAVIDTTNGWTVTGAGNAGTQLGDLCYIQRGKWQQVFACALSTAAGTKILPLEALTAATAYPASTPIYAQAQVTP